MRRAAIAAAVAVLCAATLAACSSTGRAEGDIRYVAGDGSTIILPPAEREPAPAISAPTLADGAFTGPGFDLAAQRGKVVVLNVWASWCAPCRAEAPTLAEVSTQLAPKGVSFVGIDTRDSTATAQSFVQKFGLSYPSIVDPDGQVQLLFGDSLPPQAIPSTVVIDRDGRVAARALGRVDAATLRGLVEPLLKP